MSAARSTNRRRRLWLIKAVEERGAERFESAAAALALASETEADRLDAEALRRQLFALCGAKSSTRLRLELRGAEPITVMMNRPYLLIGSDHDCDLRLDHDEIKPRHYFLQWVAGRIFCCDLTPSRSLRPDRNATNGRWLSDQPIEIGPYLLSLESSFQDDVPDYSPLDRSQQLAMEMPRLGFQFEGVEQADNHWPVNRPLTLVGRSSHCKLRLNHTEMAYVQACLLRLPGGCWLIDIAGNGTTGVNGRAVRISPVEVGDSLTLGPFQIEVVTMALQSIHFVATQKPSIQKTLPPIRFDREPKNPSKQGDSTADRSEDSLPPIRLPELPRRKSITTTVLEQPEVGPSSQEREAVVLPLIQPHVPERSPSDKPIARPTVKREIAATPAVAIPQTTETPKELAQPIEKSSTMVATEYSLAEFIQQQQDHLTELKSRLDKLKSVYDAACGQLISKKLRDSLEAPVVETLVTYEAMRESLGQLVESIENRVL